VVPNGVRTSPPLCVVASIIEWVSGGRNVNEPFLWTCPTCEKGATVTSANRDHELVLLDKVNADGPRGAVSVFVVCPNPECRRFSLYVLLYKVEPTTKVTPRGRVYNVTGIEPLGAWRLVPASAAKAFPDYIPEQIREDYTQASLIRELSPKASATLARRCLQGMIRDFYGVRKDRLKDEIEAMQDRVDPLTWGAIDAVRSVGNIGAHMEKDINVIIDVEPGEAALLIGLIERLIEDWYIARHEREKHLKEIVVLKDAKERERHP
jgi:hypothetical protein